ncbi:MAG TPA: glycosyltransferase, partial [Longimicrobiaceae bacterium]|nr:glycosyltransferase [Longimicrobiaceae bacterium]
MKSPLVSIITPAYNQSRYIAACVESVLAQGYGNWEQIVVDDGSTDGTPDVVEGYADPRVRCIRLPHRGLASLAETYNTGLAASRGELVAVLEGDDLWPADKLALQVRAFDDPGVFLSWGRGTLVDEDGRRCGDRVAVRTRRAVKLFDHADLFRRLTRVNLLTPTVTVMVRRAALEEVGGFRQSGSTLFVDLPTWLWMAATSRGHACFLNEELGHYRIHRRQTTQEHGNRMDAEHLQVVLELERRLDPATLRALGWDSGVRNRAVVAGLIAAGMGELGHRRFHAARGSFAEALAEAGAASDRVRAALGVVSAVSRVNFLRAAYATRDFTAAAAARLFRTRDRGAG